MRAITRSPLAAALASLVCGAAPAASPEPALHIEVHNLVPGRGQLLVGVCREAEFLKAACTWRAIVPVAADPTTVLVPRTELPPGRYAVQIVYDRNANRKLDTNLLGIPREPVGFSRNATGRFGPPGFEQAAVGYDGTMLQLRIDLY